MRTFEEYTLKVVQQAGNYNEWLFSLISQYLRGDILEIGAGIGNFTGLLAKKGKLTTIDCDHHYLKMLKKKFNQKVSIGYGDIAQGRYFFKKGRKFDCIVCMNVLEHIKYDGKAIKNIKNLLKNKGRLLLLTPASPVIYGALDKKLKHFRRYSKKKLKVILESNGLKLKLIRFINILGWWGWLVHSKILNNEKLSQNELKIFEIISRPVLYLEKYIELPVGLSLLVVAEKI